MYTETVEAEPEAPVTAARRLGIRANVFPVEAVMPVAKSIQFVPPSALPWTLIVAPEPVK
jgi:hypothetical protein